MQSRLRPSAHGSVRSVSGSLWAQPDSAPAQSESEADESSELEELLLLSDLFSLSSTSSSSMSSSFWKGRIWMIMLRVFCEFLLNVRQNAHQHISQRKRKRKKRN